MSPEITPSWSRADWSSNCLQSARISPMTTATLPLKKLPVKLSLLLLDALWSFYTKYACSNCKEALGFARTCKEQLSAKRAACVITQHNTLHRYHFARCASLCPICEGVFWLSLSLLWQLLSLHHWCKTKEISEWGSSFALLQHRDMLTFSDEK